MSFDWKKKLKERGTQTAAAIVTPEVITKIIEKPVSVHIGRANYFERFIDQDTRLKIDVWNSLGTTGYAVRIFGFITDMNGRRKEFSEVVKPTSDRVITTKTFSPGEGLLGSFVCFPINGTPKRGQTFVRASLVSDAVMFYVKEVLFSGYLSVERCLSFPLSIIENSIDGAGNVVKLTPSNPAVGNNYLITVPTNTFYRFRAGEFTAVTSATVANRILTVLYCTAEGDIIQRTANSTLATALQTLTVGLVASSGGITFPSGMNYRYIGNINLTLMGPGFYYSIGFDNIQVGDQLSNITLTMDEYFLI